MSHKSKQKKNLTMYNETLYQVERVVQVRWNKNRQECLIKWKGYDDCYNSWEPQEHITLFYKYFPEEEKEDDPEYTENVTLPSNNPHNYHTRNKKKKPTQPSKSNHSEEIEDHTQLEVEEVKPQEYQPKKIQPQATSEELQIRRKGSTTGQPPATCSKESLVVRILHLGWDESRGKRMGRVETLNKKIISVEQDVLKARFADKVIDYYQQKMKERSCKYY